MAKAPNAPARKITEAKVGRAVAPADAENKTDAEELKHPDDATVYDEENDNPIPRRLERGSPPPDRSNAGGKRFYKGAQEIDHDLFKLDIARMKKDVSFSEIPEYQFIEHVHMFHSVDARGRPQDSCSPVGNHTHLVKVIGVSKDGVPKLEISPAVRFVIQKIKGRKVRVAVPISELEEDGDEHTHRAIYIRSERIKLQETNAEFAKLEAAVHARENPSIPGVLTS